MIRTPKDRAKFMSTPTPMPPSAAWRDFVAYSLHQLSLQLRRRLLSSVLTSEGQNPQCHCLERCQARQGLSAVRGSQEASKNFYCLGEALPMQMSGSQLLRCREVSSPLYMFYCRLSILIMLSEGILEEAG